MPQTGDRLQNLPRCRGRDGTPYLKFRMNYTNVRQILRMVHTPDAEHGGIIGYLKATNSRHYSGTFKRSLERAYYNHFRIPRARSFTKAAELAVIATGRAPEGIKTLFESLEVNGPYDPPIIEIE